MVLSHVTRSCTTNWLWLCEEIPVMPPPSVTRLSLFLLHVNHPHNSSLILLRWIKCRLGTALYPCPYEIVAANKSHVKKSSAAWVNLFIGHQRRRRKCTFHQKWVPQRIPDTPRRCTAERMEEVARLPLVVLLPKCPTAKQVPIILHPELWLPSPPRTLPSGQSTDYWRSIQVNSCAPVVHMWWVRSEWFEELISKLNWIKLN